MINAPMNKPKQRGAVTLITALVVLVMLSLLALVGSRVGLIQQRITTNNAEAATLHASAQAGLQAAMAYLVANRSEITTSWMNQSGSSNWQPCTQSVVPCDNITGSSWQYFAVPSDDLPTLPNNAQYSYQAWYFSKTVDETPASMKLDTCTQLLPNSNGLFGVLGGLVDGVLGATNGLLKQLTGSLNNLLSGVTGGNALLPSIGIPKDLCLPINIAEVPPVPPPSQINPTIHVLVQATSGSAAAATQIVMQPTSALNHLPVAAIMASNNVKLIGGVRVWGNPRPPTPEFSTLSLDTLSPLGIPLGNLVQGLGQSIGDIVTPLLGPLLNPVTQGLIGAGVDDILDLHLNVTFPLSVWAGGSIALLSEPNGASSGGGNNNGTSCAWWNVVCQLGNALKNLLNEVTDALNQLVDSLLPTGASNSITNLTNSLANVLTRTVGATGDTLENLAQGDLKLALLQNGLQSARTCVPVPDWQPAAPCTPLSQTATVFSDGNAVDPGDLAVNVKLPDIQGNGSSTGIGTATVLSALTGLLKGCTGSNCGPQFPDGTNGQPTLLKYVFGTNDPGDIKTTNNKSTSCSSFGQSTSGLHWVTGDCTIISSNSTVIGSKKAPVVLVINGDLKLNNRVTIYGIVYMRDGGTLTVKDSAGGSGRALIRGALLADGNTGMLKVTGPIDIVFDQSIIRKAGFLLGGFTTVPGSWKDWSA